jgi:hypothetical protein
VTQLHHTFSPRAATLEGDPHDPVIRGLLETQRRLWSPGGDRSALEQLRQLNPEWDLMARTLGALSMLKAMHTAPDLIDTLRGPVEHVVAETLSLRRTESSHHFLLSYGYGFRNPEGTSLFTDGELLAVLGAWERVFGDGRFASDQAFLAERVVKNMNASPIGHGESYGNECWGFCNAFAAAALATDEMTSSRSHADTLSTYLANRPIESESGMMQSEYTTTGSPLDGPEGSSLFLIATLLERVAPGLGAKQYALARKSLLRSLLGFGYSREWAPGVQGVMDVDSGPVIPLFEASPSASGLAIVASAAFDDHASLDDLMSALWATGFPTWTDGAWSFTSSNLVGDTTFLFGLLRGADLLGGS